MTTTAPKHVETPAPEVPDDAPVLDGVLVLATGTVVRVPAEGVQVATHHYDPEFGATVPVRSAFVLEQD